MAEELNGPAFGAGDFSARVQRLVRGLGTISKRIVGDFLWIALGRVVSGVGSILVVRILTHRLSAGLYSELVLAVATVALFVSVIGGPLCNAANRFYYDAQRSGNRETLKVTLWAGMGLLVLIGGLMMVLLWPLFGVRGFMLPFYLVLFLYLASSIYTNLGQAVLNVSLHRREVSILIALTTLAGPLMAIASIGFWGQELSSLIGGYTIGSSASLLVGLAFLARYGELPSAKRGKLVSRTLLLEMLAFSWPIALGSVSSWVMSVSDRFLINALLPNPETVAYYAIAYQAGSLLPQVVSTVFITLASPYIMRSYIPEKGELPNVEMWTGTLSWITLPCLAITILFSKRLILLLAPESYLVAQSVVPFPSIALALYPLYQVISNVYHLRKRLLTPTLFSLLAGCLRIGLNLVLIPKMGLLGAAVTTTGTYLVEMVLGLTVARRQIYWKFPWKWMGVGAAATIIGAAIALAVRRAYPGFSGWTGDLLLMGIFGFSYLLALGLAYAVLKRHFSFNFSVLEPNEWTNSRIEDLP